MRYVPLLFIILFSWQALAVSIDERRQGILNIIDQELSEVRRLSNQTGNRNPDHLLRIAELYLEKARLYKEKENEEFLNLSDAQRRRANKKEFFKTSSTYFNAANTACLKITREFKGYRNMGDVYYILAYNAKEDGNEKRAQYYFGLATKKSKRNTQTEVKSKISLAEIYYNQKKYSRAIPLYEAALRSYQDRWYTKDALNLAWCYFRTNRYSNAINKMLEVYNKSKNNQFVDMSAQVERDIGLFYATSGRIDEGIRFYEKLDRNFSEELLMIAIKLKDEGQYTKASEVLNQALKYEKGDERRGKIYAEQLELYDKFGRTASHLKASQNLLGLVKKGTVGDFERKRLEYFAGKYSAVLQKQVASKTYKRATKTLLLKSSQANSYFEILKELQPNKTDEILFLQGETSYAANQMPQAMSYYEKSYALSKQQKNEQFVSRSLDGMLAVLASKRTPSRVKEQYYTRTYEAYLEAKPTGKSSYQIYQRLFNVYEDKNDLANAEKTLDKFAKAYPRDFRVQEAMLAKLMERHRKTKNYDKIRLYINDINSKKYVVSKRFANKLKELLTTIQIESVQNSLDKGDKKVALVGYHKILKDPHSTPRAKINAKYNLSALYYELGATKESYNWSVEAIQEMPIKDAVNFSDSFLAIASFLFGKTQFQASADLSLRILAKLCSQKTSKKNIAFKNSVYLYLAEHDIEKTVSTIELGEKCKVSTSDLIDAKLELLKDYRDKKRLQDYERLALELEAYPQAYSELIIAYDDLQNIHQSFGNTNSQQNFYRKKLGIYAQAKKRKVNLTLGALDVIAKHELENLYALDKRLRGVTLSFPESTFNSQIKTKLTLIDQMTGEASRIQKMGSGLGIVESYRIIARAYYDTAKEIEAFTPPGKSADYVKSFKGAMTQVSNPLSSQGAKFAREGMNSVEVNDILRPENHDLFSAVTGRFAVNYWYYKDAVLMDRGGKR